jgi:hypothetical protein
VGSDIGLAHNLAKRGGPVELGVVRVFLEGWLSKGFGGMRQKGGVVHNAEKCVSVKWSFGCARLDLLGHQLHYLSILLNRKFATKWKFPLDEI